MYVLLALLFLFLISGSKKQQQKYSYQSEVPFSSHLVGYLENKARHVSSLLQILHENNSDASLKREKRLEQ